MDEYIREHRDRYTREAVTQQLIAAGNDRDAIEAAWRSSDAERAAARAARGWRMGWREFWILLVIGAIATGITWAPSRYGGAGLAVIVYVIAVCGMVGVGKVLSLLIDSGNGPMVAILILVGGIVAVVVGLQPGGGLVLAVGVVAVVPAGALLLLGWRDPRLAGIVGAFIPVLVWLVLTGVCISPLFTGGVS